MTGVFIFGVIVAVIATLLFANEIWADDIGEWAMSAVLGTFVGILAMLLSTFMGLVAQTSPSDPIKQNIYAIKDNSEVHGNFALGFGSVDDKQYYYYVVKDSRDFKAIKKAEVESSKVKEENIDQPHVLIYKERFDSAFARFMYGEYRGGHTYEFVVPIDTITTEFNIDLE